MSKSLLFNLFFTAFILFHFRGYCQYSALTSDQLQSEQKRIETRIQILNDSLDQIKNELSIREANTVKISVSKIDSFNSHAPIIKAGLRDFGTHIVFSKASSNSGHIGSVEGIDSLVLYDYDKNTYWMINYNGTAGWILDAIVLDFPNKLKIQNDLVANKYKAEIDKKIDSELVQSDKNKIITVHNTLLFEYGGAKNIGTIPPNTVLYFIGHNNGKYIIKYNNQLGWIYDIDAADQKTTTKVGEGRKQAMIEKYGKINGLKVFEKRVWTGMTKDMLLDSWGKPNDINRDVGIWGVHEQWIYGEVYIYLENNIVTSWQD